MRRKGKREGSGGEKRIKATEKGRGEEGRREEKRREERETPETGSEGCKAKMEGAGVSEDKTNSDSSSDRRR